MLLAITALLILSWLVSVFVLNIASALVHILILLAVMAYILHLLRRGQIA
ncbi:MAG: DUF5670 family protein [Novosphingobium sp.]